MGEERFTRGGELELVGLAEAAGLLGVSKAALCERRRHVFTPGDVFPVFPEPVARLKCGPVWLRSQIDEYGAEVERLASVSRFARRNGELDQTLEEILERMPLSPGRQA